MNEEILKLADLSNVKEGDTIWTIPYGELIIRHVKDFDPFPLKTEIIDFTKDGKNCRTNKYPSAFTKNPFENTGFQERWMMVRNEKQEAWKKRKVMLEKNGYYLYWSKAFTDIHVENSRTIHSAKYAKEIEELELTLEEIADKFGVSVESIKIKK